MSSQQPPDSQPPPTEPAWTPPPPPGGPPEPSGPWWKQGWGIASIIGGAVFVALVVLIAVIATTAGSQTGQEARESLAADGESTAADSELQASASVLCDEALEADDQEEARRIISREVSAMARGNDAFTPVQLRLAVTATCGDDIDRLPEPEPSYYEPDEDDFELEITVLEQQCFGSAGCNVEFRIELFHDFVGELDPDKTYELTYEILGGDDPKVNTLEIQGDSYSYTERERIGTPSSSSVLTAEVVRMTER